MLDFYIFYNFKNKSDNMSFDGVQSVKSWDKIQALDWFNMKHNRVNLLVISRIYNTVEYHAMLSNK